MVSIFWVAFAGPYPGWNELWFPLVSVFTLVPVGAPVITLLPCPNVVRKSGLDTERLGRGAVPLVPSKEIPEPVGCPVKLVWPVVFTSAYKGFWVWGFLPKSTPAFAAIIDQSAIPKFKGFGSIFKGSPNGVFPPISNFDLPNLL